MTLAPGLGGASPKSPLPGYAGIALAAIGCLVLAGWILDIRVLKTILPGYVCMNPASAVLFILFGTTLRARVASGAGRGGPMRWLPLVAVGVGASKLSDIALGTRFGLDQLLFRADLAAMPGLAPNRMAPNTALNFCLLGLALHASFRPGSYRKAFGLAAPSFLLAFLAFMGYLFGAKPLYGVLNYVPMALHTAASLLITCVAIVYLYPERGLAGLLASRGAGGILARRMLPAVLVLPTVLGCLMLLGERHGWYDANMGLALVMLATMAGLLALVAASATTLDKADLSRQRASEAMREAMRAAEDASLAKSRFLANMSHELRTPLNSVIGFANILLKNKQGRLNESDLAYLARIQGNGRHLLSLINDVLDLSKIEAGKLELELGPCRVEELVRETLAQIECQVAGKPVALRHELPETLSPISTDAGKLRQVLINLVGNAAKFTQKGEVVVAVRADAGGSPIAISIADTGIGIPADRLESVFEAFQQADHGFGRKYGGTGLGLTISRSLCGLMGYSLEAVSAPERGSVFTIRMGERAAAASAR